MIHLRACTQIQAFREALNDARSIASALPGGEMVIEEQEDVIAMLERLRAKKRYVCCVFPFLFFFFPPEREKETKIILSRAD